MFWGLVFGMAGFYVTMSYGLFVVCWLVVAVVKIGFWVLVLYVLHLFVFLLVCLLGVGVS